nr:glucan endo-1,3-beta-glucosidase 11 [Quercus suber]
MLFAQIDSVYFAISMLGYNGISICVSETGWPSKGDVDEFGATLDNAAKYNGNLISMVAQNKVTLLKPNSDLDVYIFALFNENMKPGPTSERNFGYFNLMIDSVYFAISMLGYNGISICVSETGWPSKGDVDEFGATLDNAAKYNGNLISMVAQNKVTLLKPNSDLDVYIFALFNENMKPGPTSERNFGYFNLMVCQCIPFESFVELIVLLLSKDIIKLGLC